MREDIRYFTPCDEHVPFAIELLGKSYCDGTYRVERKKSNVLVMEYVISGKGTIEVDGQKFIASEGDVYILPQSSRHIYYSDDKEPWIKIFFNIYGELPMQLLKSYHLQNERIIKNCPMKEQFEYFHKVAGVSKSVQEIFEMCAIVYHQIIIDLRQFIQNNYQLPQEVVKLKDFLDMHIEENITINDLAAIINRSPDYTIKIFKKYYQDTPYAYLLKMKMQVAQGLLRNTSLPIKTITEKIGFCDPHYFSNMFKKSYGISPQVYRRQNL